MFMSGKDYRESLAAYKPSVYASPDGSDCFRGTRLLLEQRDEGGAGT